MQGNGAAGGQLNALWADGEHGALVERGMVRS